MRLVRSLLPVALGAAVSPIAGAQQHQPAIRPLGAIVARSDAPIGSVFGVRALPGGRLLVNDVAGRRVLLLDSTLSVAKATVVADSTAATATAYSGRMAGLIPYRGDSSLFIDPQSMSMMLIDPSGRIGRVMSVPKSQDVMSLVGPMSVNTGFDAAGRLVYRAPLRFVMNRPAGTPGAAPSGLPPMPQMPDSIAIVRVDLTTRAVDTIGRIRVPRPNMQVTTDDKGNVNIVSEINPLPVIDDWAVTSSGAVAFLRGRDYHVDWVQADGRQQSSPKMPFDWQRLSDEDKVAFIDSVKAARERLLASSPTPPGGVTTTTTSTPAPGGGETRTQVMVMGGDGPRGAAGGGPAGGMAPKAVFVSPSDLPDYKPPFFAGALRADLENHLWVRTIPTRTVPGGPVYDVVNDQGELVERVQVPAGRSIVGFGRGVVYLLSRAADGSSVLEAAAAR